MTEKHRKIHVTINGRHNYSASARNLEAMDAASYIPAVR